MGYIVPGDYALTRDPEGSGYQTVVRHVSFQPPAKKGYVSFPELSGFLSLAGCQEILSTCKKCEYFF